MKKVLHKVFGQKEDRLQDEDITHIGGVETEPAVLTPTSPVVLPDQKLQDQKLQEQQLQQQQVYEHQVIPQQEMVQETIHPVETEVVQPVIHRERVQTEIRQVTQPVLEKDVLPTTQETKILPAQYKETILPATTPTRDTLSQPESLKQTVVAEPEKRVVYNEPLIHETVKYQTVEQVQPVIYREVEQHHVIQTEQPIFERVVEAPKIISEQRAPIERT